uniref:Putative ovule protein n=1 Tax=Solanum chacoense TaxID=4108 RepID=A0A0V0HI93_SOLCH
MLCHSFGCEFVRKQEQVPGLIKSRLIASPRNLNAICNHSMSLAIDFGNLFSAICLTMKCDQIFKSGLQIYIPSKIHVQTLLQKLKISSFNFKIYGQMGLVVSSMQLLIHTNSTDKHLL